MIKTSSSSTSEPRQKRENSTRNGKSTLMDTVKYLFGDYGMNTQPETLAQKDRDSRSASGDIARLNGCRLLQMSEPPKRMKLDVAALKTLIGRDVITARRLYEHEFEFIPVFKLFINTNHLPVVMDNTLFSSGRVRVITFDRHFEPEEQDKGLKDRLKTDENLSGILNWLLEGNQRYRNDSHAFDLPDAVTQATEDYRRSSDKIQNFIDDCLEPTSGNCSAGEAYASYCTWCGENGFGTENKRSFFDELKNKGIFADSGTVSGRTVKNVIKGYVVRGVTVPF